MYVLHYGIFQTSRNISILQSELGPSDLSIFFFFLSYSLCLTSFLCSVLFLVLGNLRLNRRMMRCTFHLLCRHIYVMSPSMSGSNISVLRGLLFLSLTISPKNAFFNSLSFSETARSDFSKEPIKS